MNTSSLTGQQAISKKATRINVLLNQLRHKLKDFVVKDRQGKLLGQVKNIQLDTERQLNLVIEQADEQMLLSSKHIQKIDTPAHELFMDVSRTEIRYPSSESSIATQADSTRLPAESLVASSIAHQHDYPTMNSANQNALNENALNQEGHSSMPMDPSVQLPASTVREATSAPKVVAEEVVPLLEERLSVHRAKHKAGEVIVRKTVEVRMVEVPVRYEKLVVEQVSPDRRQLAEFNLGQGEITGMDPSSAPVMKQSGPTVRGEFTSLRTASWLLDSIAMQRPNGCKKVRIEIEVEDSQLQDHYQAWFNRCAGQSEGNSSR